MDAILVSNIGCPGLRFGAFNVNYYLTADNCVYNNTSWHRPHRVAAVVMKGNGAS